jgi:hypothetical protein
LHAAYFSLKAEYHGLLNMSSPKTDDLEAVRLVVEAVKDFKLDEQQRIFRWAAEKLGMSLPAGSGYTPPPPSPAGSPSSHPPTPPAPGAAMDIKTFMADKKPRNDVQYAAAVAYYYRFEAPPAERKEAINKEDLQEATRKSGRDRFGNPLQTLNNAHTLGLLDRSGEKGSFVINSVGENLVAMTLPDGGTPKKATKKKAAKKKGSKA